MCRSVGAALCLIAVLSASSTLAQNKARAFANKKEYDLATKALQERNVLKQVEALLAWESAYPKSAFAPERVNTMIYAFRG